MHEAAAAGEWISVWLSPFAYFLLDAVFAVVVLVLTRFALKALRRARHRDARPTS
jgi:hypothetical protein